MCNIISSIAPLNVIYNLFQTEKSTNTNSAPSVKLSGSSPSQVTRTWIHTKLSTLTLSAFVY